MTQGQNAKLLQAYREAVCAGHYSIADALEDVILEIMDSGKVKAPVMRGVKCGQDIVQLGGGMTFATDHPSKGGHGMSEIKLTIRPFRMGTEKEAALKPLEEASEVRAEWQTYERMTKNERLQAKWEREYNDEQRDVLADEIADCIQACVNLADRYDIDLTAAMERCEGRNRERGRYE